MKKMTLKSRLFGGVVAVSAALLAVSCAQGFDDNERFSGGVTDTQLESPLLDLSCFATIANADGTETVKLTWPVVYGAGGYAVEVADINDETAPVMLVDTLIDGLSVSFPKTEDTNYSVRVKTLGNEKLNNTEAVAPTDYLYSTWAPSQTVPAGSELSAFIAAHLTEPEDLDLGQGFVLEAGAEYTLESDVDFGLYNMVLRGASPSNRPTVRLVGDAKFVTQAGLKVKYVNFDCTESTASTLLGFSADPDASLSTEALGFKKDGANQNGFVILKPVIFEECRVKNLHKSFIYGQTKPWSLKDFRIVDCIIQLDNTGDATFLNLSGGGNGLLKEMTIRNSTIYNLVRNSSAYFIRYSNASNAQPKKIFGNSNNSTTHRIENCTIAKVFSNKDFANSCPNTSTVYQYVTNVVFYDIFRLYKYLDSQNKKYTTDNTIWYNDASQDSNDLGGRKDSNGNPFVILEDPGFTEPFAALDLSQPNGGVHFKANGALSSTIGDPRWLE